MTRLNLDSDSPFRGAISTPTSPDGYIKDNSVLKMIENSLYDGALYQYRSGRHSHAHRILRLPAGGRSEGSVSLDCDLG